MINLLPSDYNQDKSVFLEKISFVLVFLLIVLVCLALLGLG